LNPKIMNRIGAL